MALRPLSIGWHGKLPSRGDFVGRGLPRPWLRAWDDWLQRGLVIAGRRWGSGLRERLAAMPPWQAMVPARPGQGPAWCLVVVGSTDRVGRAFPLVLAEAHDPVALDDAPLSAWQARAEQLAGWLATAAPGALPRDLDTGVADWAARDWAVAAEGGDTLGELRVKLPVTGSFWWPASADAPGLAPRTQPWLPHDTLVLDWLGEDDTVPPGLDGG